MERAVVQGPPVLAADPEVAPRTSRIDRTSTARWAIRVASGCAAIAASILVMFALDVNVLRDQSKPTHVMSLHDGSVVTLPEDARIEVALSDRDRRITLLSGEATFKVAKDAARPFVVRSGAVYAQATGTEYSVRRLGAAGAAVHVVEGSVLVWAREDREQAVLLHAGGDLTLEPGKGASAPSQPLPSPAVAQISLDGVSIASAAARFNSLNETQIVIDDRDIGEIKIIGLFSAHDPEQFARAAAVVADARVVRRGRDIVLQRQ